MVNNSININDTKKTGEVKIQLARLDIISEFLRFNIVLSKQELILVYCQ